MKKMKIGVIGIGAMGSSHLVYIGEQERLALTAVCDIDKTRADFSARKYNVKAFYDYKEMLYSGLVEAVIVSTPHYSHTPITIEAFKAGIHVLTEKPVAAHIADARKMIEAYKKTSGLSWGVMFQQRTHFLHMKLKELLTSNEFGEIKRINYKITDWFRAQSYYDSSSWRATWKGEGGGVLLNQSLHQLDLFQWFFGMPEKIRAYCKFGKYHDIEVEDEATVYMEYGNDLSAVMIISSGETPGENRLEILADKGKIVLEDDKIIIDRNSLPASVFLKTSLKAYASPETSQEKIIPSEKQRRLHKNVISRFIDNIFDRGIPLIAEGYEGLNAVMLANSILYSSLADRTVELPLDGNIYAEKLNELIRNSDFKKNINTKIDFRDFSPPYLKS